MNKVSYIILERILIILDAVYSDENFLIKEYLMPNNRVKSFKLVHHGVSAKCIFEVFG